MTDNIYVTSATWAIVVSVVLQVLKNTPLFPWLNRNTGHLNAIVSFAAALVTSLGIIATFDFNKDTGYFQGQFHGNLWDVAHMIGHTVAQWAAQHGFYKGAIVPAETLGEIRAMLARALTPPPISEAQAKTETGGH